MKELFLVGALIGQLTVTSYRSIPAQTKPAHCHYTSIGERCNVHGIAVSQDLLKSGRVHYGDLVYVEEVGYKFVNDTMNKRHNDAADVWVETYDQEKAFDTQFHGKRLKVWVIK